MKLHDILSQDEIREYHESWDSFTGKYNLETPYRVHSGFPIIGQVFQFRDKPVFRAHIFKRRIEKAFDPYFMSDKGYLHQYFHTIHYFFPIEQLYHASMFRLVPNYEHFITTDRFDKKRPQEMNGRIDFDKTRPSIELVLDIKLGKEKILGRANFTFYNDRTNKNLQMWYLEGVGTLREYVKNLKRLKQGDKEAIECLVREIEDRETEHRKLKNPRTFPSKDELITKLRMGEIPEEELHDFFSYWDKPNNLKF